MNRIVGTLVLIAVSATFVSDKALAANDCRNFSINAALVNVRKDAEIAGSYIDVLQKGDLACVTDQKSLDGRAWGFVKHKTSRGGKVEEVNGWANLKYLQERPTEIATPKKQPPLQKPKEVPSAAKTEKPATNSTSAAKPEKQETSAALRFDQPVPFGAFPVRGSSLEELLQRTPMFSPIEGLDEALWKKNCFSCHKWNKARLCEQGHSYVKAARYVLRHQHPFGGAYKVALMRWAKSGCN